MSIDQSATRTRPDCLELPIHPDDEDQALVAGVQFARAVAGAENAAFMLALGEQVALVQSAIATVEFSPTNARLAAEAGAREEWQRIGGMGGRKAHPRKTAR